MAVNFCLPQFKPRIHCNTVMRDDHEVQNLISDDYWRRRKGFIAEYFVKPPVTVTIEFPCLVEIKSINIDPIVGAQKSCSFEIFTHSAKERTQWLNEEGAAGSPATVDGIFTPIGRYLGNKAEPICFVNHRFTPKGIFRDLPQHMTSLECQTLRHHHYINLSKVSHVSLRITRTENCSPPAIKNLEVWGQPSASTDKFLVQQIYRKLLPESRTEMAPASTPSAASGCTDMSSLSSSSSAMPLYSSTSTSSYLLSTLVTEGSENDLDNIDIPEEFLDPITCKIMALPVLLPSGHCVDQSTLDKFEAQERIWGRLPNDPFTGTLFSQRSGPIPNSALKARIDQWLMDHETGHGITMGRTVGRATDLINQRAVQSKGLRKSELLKATVKLEQTTSTEAPAIIPTGDTVDIAKPHLKREYSAMNYRTVAKRPRLDSTRETSSGSHQDNLSASLNSALNETLKGLPSFRKFKSSEDVEITESCVQCNAPQTKNAFYSMTCEHILCRGCLLKSSKGNMDSILCAKCSKLCKREEIVRKYV